MKKIKLLSLACGISIYFLSYPMEHSSEGDITFFEIKTDWKYQHAITHLMIEMNDILNPLALLLLIIPHSQPPKQHLWPIIGELSAQRNKGGGYNQKTFEYMGRLLEHAILPLIDHGFDKASAKTEIRELLILLKFKSIKVEAQWIEKSSTYEILFKKNDSSPPVS